MTWKEKLILDKVTRQIADFPPQASWRVWSPLMEAIKRVKPKSYTHNKNQLQNLQFVYERRGNLRYISCQDWQRLLIHGLLFRTDMDHYGPCVSLFPSLMSVFSAVKYLAFLFSHRSLLLPFHIS